jgi:predicted nucleotidyltransferase
MDGENGPSGFFLSPYPCPCPPALIGGDFHSSTDQCFSKLQDYSRVDNMKAKTKTEIIEFLKKNRLQLESFGVSKIGVFGSFLRNEQTEDSDIDILVDFYPEKVKYDNFIDLAFYLEDHLERSVDLVTVGSLSPYIGPHILREVEYVAI